MAVEVHRVHHVRVVGDGHLDEIAFLDDERGHVGIDPSVDRPLPPRPTVEEPGLPRHLQLEAAIVDDIAPNGVGAGVPYASASNSPAGTCSPRAGARCGLSPIETSDPSMASRTDPGGWT